MTTVPAILVHAVPRAGIGGSPAGRRGWCAPRAPMGNYEVGVSRPDGTKEALA